MNFLFGCFFEDHLDFTLHCPQFDIVIYNEDINNNHKSDNLRKWVYEYLDNSVSKAYKHRKDFNIQNFEFSLDYFINHETFPKENKEITKYTDDLQKKYPEFKIIRSIWK